MVGAAAEGRTEAVEMLIEKGADVNAALWIAKETGRTKIVRLLKQAGAKE